MFDPSLPGALNLEMVRPAVFGSLPRCLEGLKA